MFRIFNCHGVIHLKVYRKAIRVSPVRKIDMKRAEAVPDLNDREDGLVIFILKLPVIGIYSEFFNIMICVLEAVDDHIDPVRIRVKAVFRTFIEIHRYSVTVMNYKDLKDVVFKDKLI